jgi:peptide/nickel transport system substrate-binding protein
MTHFTARWRHSSNRLTQVVAIGAVTVLTLTACGSSHSKTKPSGSETQSASGGTLSMGATIAPQSLSPILNQGNPESLMVMQLAYDPLIQVTPDGKMTPDLATAWKWDDSTNTKFELTIRTNAKFSDGTPLTAQTVAKSLLAFRDGKGPNAKQAKDFTSVEATNDSTVVITSATPDPGIPSKLGQLWGVGYIVSEAGLSDPASLASKTAGAGPYMLDAASSQIGNHYTFVKNPNYWDPSKVKYDKVTYTVISDQNALLSAMKTGSIDYFPADPVTAASAVKEGAKEYNTPSTLAGIRFLDRDGQLVPILKDVRVRQAFQYAIDRKAIANALGYGYAKPYTQFMAPGVAGYYPEFDNYYSYDPTKAKQLLADAGYPSGLTLDLTQAQQAGGQVAFTSAMIAQLAKAGIKINQVVVPSSQHSANVNGKKFPLAGGSFGGGYEALMFYNFTIAKGAFSNPFGVTDPAMDSLFLKAATETGAAAAATNKQAIKSLLDTSWFVPVLLIQQADFVSSSRVKGADGGPYAYPNPAFFTPAS